MWHQIRYAFNWLLTAFQIVGLTLLVLGTGILALLVAGTLVSVIQYLLGFEPLLTQDRLYWPLVFVFVTCGLGAILGELGLSATDPKFLKKLMEEEKQGL